jgi:hypothetical protein
MSVLAAQFAQGVAFAHADRRASLQIGQPKSRPPIASVGCAEQRKERLVLIDGKKIAVA